MASHTDWHAAPPRALHYIDVRAGAVAPVGLWHREVK